MYKNGKKNGKCILYNIRKDEQPEFIRYYKDDKKNGPSEQFNDKGKKISWGTYKDGDKHGTWYEYIMFDKTPRSKEWLNGAPQK